MCFGFAWPCIEILSGANNLYVNLEIHQKSKKFYIEINWPDEKAQKKIIIIILGKCFWDFYPDTKELKHQLLRWD